MPHGLSVLRIALAAHGAVDSTLLSRECEVHLLLLLLLSRYSITSCHSLPLLLSSTQLLCNSLPPAHCRTTHLLFPSMTAGTRRSPRSSTSSTMTAAAQLTSDAKPDSSKRSSTSSANTTTARSDRDLMPPPPPKKRRTATPPQSPQPNSHRTPRSPSTQSAQSTDADDDAANGQRNYGEEGYWEDRYRRQLSRSKRQVAEEKKQGPDEDDEDDDDDVTSEWYYDWKTLTPLLDITATMRHSPVLDLGCGLSALFSDLIADGFTGPLLGIDSAPSVLTEQRGRFPPASNPNVSFTSRSLFSTAYLTATPSERHRYGLIVDKATSDGIMCATYTTQQSTPPLTAARRRRPAAHHSDVPHGGTLPGAWWDVRVCQRTGARQWMVQRSDAGWTDRGCGGSGGSSGW